MDREYQQLVADAFAHAAQMIQAYWQCAAGEYERPSVLFRPKLSIDGDQWCALYGDNLQDGVAGFGDSPAKAMYDFDRAWQKSLPETRDGNSRRQIIDRARAAHYGAWPDLPSGVMFYEGERITRAEFETTTGRVPARPVDQRGKRDKHIRCASCDQGFLPGEVFDKPRECCAEGNKFDKENYRFSQNTNEVQS